MSMLYIPNVNALHTQKINVNALHTQKIQNFSLTTRKEFLSNYNNLHTVICFQVTIFNDYFLFSHIHIVSSIPI